MWKNIVQLDRPQMTKRCKRIACWITTATHTHTHTHTHFHCNNGCMNTPQCYVIRTLPALFRLPIYFRPVSRPWSPLFYPSSVPIFCIQKFSHILPNFVFPSIPEHPGGSPCLLEFIFGFYCRTSLLCG